MGKELGKPLLHSFWRTPKNCFFFAQGIDSRYFNTELCPVTTLFLSYFQFLKKAFLPFLHVFKKFILSNSTFLWTNSTIGSCGRSRPATHAPPKPIPKPDPPPGDRHNRVESGIGNYLKKGIQRLYVHIIIEEED